MTAHNHLVDPGNSSFLTITLDTSEFISYTLRRSARLQGKPRPDYSAFDRSDTWFDRSTAVRETSVSRGLHRPETLSFSRIDQVLETTLYNRRDGRDRTAEPRCVRGYTGSWGWLSNAVLSNLCAAAQKCAARAVEVSRGRMSENQKFSMGNFIEISTVIESVQFSKFSHGTLLPIHDNIIWYLNRSSVIIFNDFVSTVSVWSLS